MSENDEGMRDTEAKPDPATWPPVVFLTRDAHDDGTAADTVEVWPSRPPRADGRSIGESWVLWGGEDAPLQRLTLGAARRAFGTVPDNARECVCAPPHFAAKVKA